MSAVHLSVPTIDGGSLEVEILPGGNGVKIKGSRNVRVTIPTQNGSFEGDGVHDDEDSNLVIQVTPRGRNTLHLEIGINPAEKVNGNHPRIDSPIEQMLGHFIISNRDGKPQITVPKR